MLDWRSSKHTLVAKRRRLLFVISQNVDGRFQLDVKHDEKTILTCEHKSLTTLMERAEGYQKTDIRLDWKYSNGHFTTTYKRFEYKIRPEYGGMYLAIRVNDDHSLGVGTLFAILRLVERYVVEYNA